MPNKPITRHQNEGSQKAEAKVTKALEIKNHAHCQGATKVPGKRINLTSGLNTKEPPTKHLACSVALYNSSPIIPRAPAHRQGATKVPGKRINLTSGLNTKEPPTKHLACSVALYNSSPIIPRVPAHFPLSSNRY